MDFRAFVNSKVWKPAKTYESFAPHEYIVRTNYRNPEEFAEAVRYIHKYGFSAKFGKMEHIYLPIDGYYYWNMGDAPEDTIIINRCKISDYETTMKFKFRGKKNGDEL